MRGTDFTSAFESSKNRSGNWWSRPMGARDPSDCLKDLLGLPVRVENVTLKRPSLNDVFLQLTGRELRE